ncbi:MAG: D-glycero-beta-D-manno-heptose-7-phosphate kinase [Candidatus Marinimicrobia bacterium]|nr:D-glycero-beta-D-manno-heptose-7-phosphate kinase [Candidatus Neomarinimicrobiota bacterium]
MKELFQNFKNLNILVVGDLILDNYIWGSVNRISPEAPVPVVTVNRRENRIGGAGNVAANLASLNVNVTIAGVCGEDKNAEILKDLFNNGKIRPFLIQTPSRKTTTKSRVIAQRQQLLRIDEEDTEPVKKDIARKLISMISLVKENFDGVILSDYAKGLLSEEFIQEILMLFGNKPVIIDPKGFNYRKYHGATTIKPNFREFTAAVRHPELTKDEMDDYARKLVKDLDLKGIVVTLGEEGVYILNNKSKSLRIPTKAKEVYDVSGAGDTFIASFTAGLILSGDWFVAAKAGNLASGVVVGKIGTATATIEEMFNHIDLIG